MSAYLVGSVGEVPEGVELGGAEGPFTSEQLAVLLREKELAFPAKPGINEPLAGQDVVIVNDPGTGMYFTHLVIAAP